MLKTSIYLIATVSLLTFSVSKATEVILEDTPNVGDTTTITTVTTGNPVTTGNLISQQFNDGSWVGTMFPDSSDINESTWLTGKHGKYAETTINSEDHLTLPELQAGFTSTFGAQIRWWNPVESTVTLTQTATNGIDTTTQSTTFVDTTNHNYQTNPYSNQLTLAPDSENQHGTLTLRFSFDILGNKNYNGGHAGVDVRDPYVNVEYNTLSSTTSTSVVYCWQKNPPTCPGQEEIQEVQDTLQNFESTIQDFEIPEDIFIPEYIEIEYDWNDDFFEDDIVVEEDFDILAIDDFFFEEDYFEADYYEEPGLELFIPEDTMFEEMPIIEEVYEAVPEELFVENFTEEMQEEFIDEVEEYFEEVTMEEPQPEADPEPMEEIAMVEEETIQEEPKEEVANEIEEQPSSEEPVADEPQETASVAEQEETIEEPTEVAVVEGKPTEEPDAPTESVEVDLDVKVAAIEKAIQSKIKDVTQQIDVTLTVVNELVSREMISQQPDMTSYFNANTALFDTRQLPSGNQNFFLQTNLDSYSKPIYVAQANIAGTDPVVQHQIKVNEAKQKTNEAYRKLKELINARNVQ